MSITIKDFAVGKKTFFITPDLSLFPESYLEDYFALGYECYFIENEKNIPLSKKVEILIRVFPGCIIFFNIDLIISDILWIPYIQSLQQRYGSFVSFGVFYSKKQNKDYKSAIEYKFLREIGIKGGCMQLEYQKNLNYGIIQNVLLINCANERRKTIRGLCTGDYTYSFMKEEVTYCGKLQDISLSHFTFLSENKLQLRIGDVVNDFNFYLNGLIMRTSAILIMKRDLRNSTLFVFAFQKEDGGNGLNERYRQMLISNIYGLKCKNLKLVFNIALTEFDKGNRELNEIELKEID